MREELVDRDRRYHDAYALARSFQATPPKVTNGRCVEEIVRRHVLRAVPPNKYSKTDLPSHFGGERPAGQEICRLREPQLTSHASAGGDAPRPIAPGKPPSP